MLRFRRYAFRCCKGIVGNPTINRVSVMTLANEDLPQLKSYFYEWPAEADSSRRPDAFEVSLQERLIRVEETLSNQIELTRQGFSAIEKNFEGMQEQMDKRFEAMQIHLDKRFDAIAGGVRNLSQRKKVRKPHRRRVKATWI